VPSRDESHESTPRGGVNRCNANQNAEMQQLIMNSANGQFKSRSEARFSIKGSKTSPLYSSR